MHCGKKDNTHTQFCAQLLKHLSGTRAELQQTKKLDYTLSTPY